MGRAPRVVITGLGTINCIGNSIEEFWQGLVEGKSGIGPITLFDASDLPCRIAGEINGFDPEQYLDRKTVRRLPRSVLLANAAAHQAVEDAGLPLSMPEPERAGVVVGTGVAGGMLAAAVVGIFIIPALYVLFQVMRERIKRLAGARETAPDTGPDTPPDTPPGD